MVAAITSEPVQGANVTVELCKDTKPSIHIRDITAQRCNEDFLELYFSNPTKSGGGEVESIEILGDNEAIVTFSDPAGRYEYLQICCELYFILHFHRCVNFSFSIFI